MTKLKKLEEFRENPSEAWEQLQTVRTKINEIISLVNGEEEISGLSLNEKIKRVENQISNSGDHNKIIILSKELEKLYKESYDNV